MNLLNELSRPLALDASGIPFLQSALNGKATPRPASPAGSGLRIEDGTAIVPLVGVMLRSCDDFLQSLGFASCEAVAEMLNEVADDSAVKRIVLAVDSPGGSVSGTIELAGLVSQINRKKPMDAFISGMGCSAAYWVASGCRSISCTPSASVGSIGVLSVHVDASAAQESSGYRIEIFRSGALKAPGAFGERLSTEQREHLQSAISEAFDLFKGHVQSHRPRLSNAVYTGQSYMGGKAASVGLTDAVEHSLNAAMARQGAAAQATDFQSLVRRAMLDGKTRSEAITATVRTFPQAHLEYIQRGAGQL